jgi:small subunit ribosomal protein S17
MTVVRGTVISARMTKAVVVRLERMVQHPEYGKYLRQRSRVKARDLLGCREGDVVELASTRPLSRDIRWRVVRVVGRRLADVRSEGSEAVEGVAS